MSSPTRPYPSLDSRLRGNDDWLIVSIPAKPFPMEGYLSLFLASFGAATILPMASEGVLAGLLALDQHDRMWLWSVATLGNTLGAVVNWGLGRYLLHFQDRKWFPVSAKQMERAHDGFQKWGSWSLLFAWVPIVGDPLTLVAGVLRVTFPLFLFLVALGKGLRYAIVVFGVDLFMNG